MTQMLRQNKPMSNQSHASLFLFAHCSITCHIIARLFCTRFQHTTMNEAYILPSVQQVEQEVSALRRLDGKASSGKVFDKSSPQHAVS